MNKSLVQRTYRKFYDDLETRLREAGASEADIVKQIDASILEAKSLLEGKCPKCGAPISRSVDHKRQQGEHSMPGGWVQYRCSTQPPIGQVRPPDVCDFMVDLVEGEAAS